MAKVKSLRELQLVELEILKDFVKFCQKNKLTYYISGGTFLGAVRHKGFIPWDDDIDVAMPRTDYARFIRLYDGKYVKSTFEDNSNLVHYALQLIDKGAIVDTINGKTEAEWSAWIDVFPLDGMPNNFLLNKIHGTRLMINRALFKLNTIDQVQNKKGRPFSEKIIIKTAKIFNPWKKQNPQIRLRKIDKLLKKYPDTESNYYINFMGTYKLKSMLRKDVYYKDGAYYDFENLKLFGPKEFDAYLTHIHGDYMTPPKVDDRNKHGTQLERTTK